MAIKKVSEGLKVVLVEDSVVIVNRMQALLAEISGTAFMGYASTISAAMRLMETTAPDVAILDINLGSNEGKTGIDLLNILKRIYPETKIIMLTNLSDSRYRALCNRHGADYFLDKSDDFERIPEIIVSLRDLKS